MSTEQKQLITPPYTLKAIKKYHKTHAETISQQKKEKYDSMTPEQKQAYLADKRQKYHQKMQSMSPEEKMQYNAKKQEYFKKWKNAKLNNTSSTLENENSTTNNQSN